MGEKWRWVLYIVCITSILTGCEASPAAIAPTTISSLSYEDACKTPFGVYEDTVTYTLGKMTGDNNSNLPAGDSYENNAFTRYLYHKINVQNKNAFEATGNIYNNMVSMAISEKNIPDVMVIDDYNYLRLLVENDLIEDLTQSYEDCASDRLKEIYSSYGDIILENATFDKKLMALPETNIDSGPNMLWLRKDWMDQLGLEDPETLEDAVYIIEQFIEQDPGGNGDGNTVGLVCVPKLTSEMGYSYMFQADIIFAKFGSFPKQWIGDQDGQAVYGSVLPEAKEALVFMNQLYQRGILDNQFLLRTSNNIIELIQNGNCGSFFGLWWAPNNPLMDHMKSEPNAQWKPYILATDEDGSTSFCTQNPCYKYVVVRKGFEHPEIVMKVNSVLFDSIPYNDPYGSEIAGYYKNNVDPTARPMSINIDYMDALKRCYESIMDVLKGNRGSESLNFLEYSYYIACKDYLDNPKEASLEDWAAYTSRITACSLLTTTDIKRVESLYFGETKTMSQNWWKLQELEKQAYLKIITGEKDINYFDEFVKEWYLQGGEAITEEIRKERTH